METDKIFSEIKDFAFGLVDSQYDWINIVLEIEIQPLMLGISASSLLKNEKLIYLDPKFSGGIKQNILELHKKTIGKDGENKWNRLKLTINRDRTFESIFEWDTIWQDEVDGFNKEAEQEDPNYKAPKWFWEVGDEELS
jgi:hypothetical protein